VGTEEDGKGRVFEALVVGAVVDSAPTVNRYIVIGLSKCQTRDQHRFIGRQEEYILCAMDRPR
jgi:hypothetical protein